MKFCVKAVKVALVSIVVVIIGACGSTPEKQYTPNMELKQARYGHAVATDGEKIYVIGGSNLHKVVTGDIEVIDPVAREIEIYKNELLPRRYATAVFDGKQSIYIIGGLTRDNKRRLTYEPRVEVYDIVKKTVRFAKSHPMPAGVNASVFHDNKIFVFGGKVIKNRQRIATASATMYDIEKQQWFKLPDMPMAMETKAVVRDGQIYLVGGYGNGSKFDSFLKFDPVKLQWSSMPNLPEPISANSLAMSAVNNFELYSFGDYDNQGRTYKFNFLSETWERVYSGLKPTRHATATSLGNKIYVIGGLNDTAKRAVNYIQEFEY